MESTPDISKVINLIMENPELIESIKSMLGKDKQPSPEIKEEQEAPTDETCAVAPTTAPIKEAESGRGRRNALLKALKPYVSEERAKAIDTMMSLADVMDIIKRG